MAFNKKYMIINTLVKVSLKEIYSIEQMSEVAETNIFKIVSSLFKYHAPFLKVKNVNSSLILDMFKSSIFFSINVSLCHIINSRLNLDCLRGNKNISKSVSHFEESLTSKKVSKS